jgi:hypothetical protein
VQLVIDNSQILQLGSHYRHFPEFISDKKLVSHGHVLLAVNPKDNSWHSMHFDKSSGSQALHVFLHEIH